MTLFVTSIVPVELFTIRRRATCIDKLKQRGLVVDGRLPISALYD